MNLVGRTFDRDRVIEKIADGGMGSVWRTEHTTLGVTRALKVMPEGFAEKPDLVERFQREAQVMAQLHHPHIVQVYDFGCQEGIYYLIMEYVSGGSLRGKLRQANGPLDWPEVLRVLDQICQGLEYAHGKGVVHRDIKPENILIDDQGRVKIADFGLGKIMENVVKTRSGSLLVKEDINSESSEQPSVQSIGRLPTRLTPGELTMLGQVVGTLEYMSPEQRRGEVVDARSDIYSLGVVLFEMLTGRPPSGMELPSDENASVPEDFDDLTRKMLAPQQRRLSDLSELRKIITGLITPRRAGASSDQRSDLPQRVGMTNQITGGSAFISEGRQTATELLPAAEPENPEARYDLAQTGSHEALADKGFQNRVSAIAVAPPLLSTSLPPLPNPWTKKSSVETLEPSHSVAKRIYFATICLGYPVWFLLFGILAQPSDGLVLFLVANSGNVLLIHALSPLFRYLAYYFIIGFLFLLANLWVSKFSIGKKALWTILLLFPNVLIMPFYWVYNVARKPRYLWPSVVGYFGLFAFGFWLRLHVLSTDRAGKVPSSMLAPASVEGKDESSFGRFSCIQNLRQIEGTKEQWALENRKREGSVVIVSGVNAFLKDEKTPVCPAGGTYFYGKVGDAPTCSVRGHTL